MEIMWTLLSVIGIMWLYIGWIGLVTALLLRNEIDGLYTDRIYNRPTVTYSQQFQDWHIFLNLRIQNQTLLDQNITLLEMVEKQDENKLME